MNYNYPIEKKFYNFFRLVLTSAFFIVYSCGGNTQLDNLNDTIMKNHTKDLSNSELNAIYDDDYVFGLEAIDGAPLLFEFVVCKPDFLGASQNANSCYSAFLNDKNEPVAFSIPDFNKLNLDAEKKSKLNDFATLYSQKRALYDRRMFQSKLEQSFSHVANLLGSVGVFSFFFKFFDNYLKYNSHKIISSIPFALSSVALFALGRVLHFKSIDSMNSANEVRSYLMDKNPTKDFILSEAYLDQYDDLHGLLLAFSKLTSTSKKVMLSVDSVENTIKDLAIFLTSIESLETDQQRINEYCLPVFDIDMQRRCKELENVEALVIVE